VTYKLLLIAPVLVAVLTMLGVTQFAKAQSSDWTLTLYPTNVPFGTDKIFLQVKGQYGADVWRWIANQQNPSTSFNLSGSQFPTGHDFLVCMGTGQGPIGNLASLDAGCSTATHDSNGNQALDASVGQGLGVGPTLAAH
jgi:hypothetical protein